MKKLILNLCLFLSCVQIFCSTNEKDSKIAKEYTENPEARRIFDEADKADAAIKIQKMYRGQATRKKTNFLKKYVIKFIPPSISKVRDAISDPSPEKIQWIIRMINHDASKMKEIVNSLEGKWKMPLLHSVIYDNQLSSVYLLILAGADVNLQDTDGEAPLHEAALRERLEIVQLLLNTKKANVNLKSNGGNTPLHYATGNKSPQIVQLLIDAKADVNIQDNQGHAPLHLATIFKQRKIVPLLINAGANRNIQNNEGETPRELINDEEIRRIFDEADKADAAAKIIQKTFRNYTTRKKISSLQKTIQQKIVN